VLSLHVGIVLLSRPVPKDKFARDRRHVGKWRLPPRTHRDHVLTSSNSYGQ
jgi:hypothetical protein